MSGRGDNRGRDDHDGGGGDNFFRRGSRRGGWDTSSTTGNTVRRGNDGASSIERSGGYGGGSSVERRSGGYGGGGFRDSGDFRRSGGYGGGGSAGYGGVKGVTYGEGTGCAGDAYGGGGGGSCSTERSSGGYGGGEYGGRSLRVSGDYRLSGDYGGGNDGRGGGGLTTLSVADWESVRSTLADEAVKKLSLSSTSSSSKKPLEPPRRPGFGNVGLRCLVKANHFLVELVGQGNFHRYNVSIEPTVPKKLSKDIMVALINTYKNSDLGNLTSVYDGRKILFTTKELPFIAKDFTVRLDDQGATSAREREFKVTIKWTSTVECNHLKQLLAARQLEPQQEMIHLLDVVLKSAENLKNYTPVGRSLFSPSMGRGPLSDGLVFWKGFYQSLRPTQMGLSLNIAASARAFYEPIAVIEYLSMRLWLPRDNRALTDYDRLRAKKALKGVTVVVSHREDRRRYKVLGLSTEPCNKLVFTSPNGGEQPIPLYFYQKYNITLRYPSLPCVEVSNSKHLINLPMEVCNIVEGQRYSNKLNEAQVKALLKATAVRPYERVNQLKKMVEQNNYNRDHLVKEFGLQVNNSFTLVEARVLPPPKLLYSGTQPQAIIDPSMGQWKMSNQRLHEPATVRFWACVNFSPNIRDASAEVFCDKLLNECSRKGMTFAVRPLIQTRSRDARQLERVLHDIHTESGQQLQLLVIILPHSASYYGKIKQICETELGIISQCCKSEKVLQPGSAYLEHVALKINVKVGGRNVVLLDAANRHIPLVTDDPTIIFGADVTHPQSGEAFSPSIAAVVASMDWPYFAKYNGLVSVQPPRQEIILDLSKTVKKLLLAFKHNNGVLPHRIIFYRDGVSEDEFSNVLLREMCAIREACQSLEEEDYLPPVTFIVVQKRHHTRFFPEDPNLTDRSQNILAGTVVDTKICHPSQFDFYLCSHAGIKGTSRPAHYHVLYDENNFTPDLLQLFTNSLCYTFARCTRSVSIVPPAYYAHLAAFRARKYIEGEACETGSSTGNAGNTLIPEVRPLPELKANIKNVMFYC